MPKNWWLPILICGGISVGLLWGGWRDWGVKAFLWVVLKFALLLLATAGLMTMCGEVGNFRGQ